MLTTALVSCRSMEQQLEQIMGEEWKKHIYYLPQILHLYPDKLYQALDGLLDRVCSQYCEVIVVYGKCAKDIDGLVRRHGAIRVSGELCYEMFAGEHFFQMLREGPGTYFLTEDLCRNFKELVIEPLGWDEHPKIKDLMLKNYRRAVFLDTLAQGSMDGLAEQIADYLGLPLEIQRVGLGNFRGCLQEVLPTA